MRRTLLAAFAALFFAVTLFALPCLAQEGAQEAAQDGAQMPPEMMEAFMKSMTPGDAHAYLARFAGEWNFTNTMWMAPGAPPETSTGTSTKRMLFDGRYLEENLHGEFMGQSFEGRALTAFDNTSQAFVGTWIDSMSTMMMVSHGDFKGGDSHTLTGEYVDPMTGQKTTARMVSRIESPDRHVFEYYTTPEGGKESKSMEVVYTRKK